MIICAKMISSLFRKVVGIDIVHILPDAIQTATASSIW